MKKRRKIIFIVISVMLILLIGTSFAYIYGLVSGNKDDTVILSLEEEKVLKVVFDEEYDDINIESFSMEENDSNVKSMMKFKVINLSNLPSKYNIYWQDLENTFCQYTNNNNECVDPSTTDNYVGDELTAVLYLCSRTNYLTSINNIESNCNVVSKLDNAIPTSDEIINNDLINISANDTNYYALIIEIENKTNNQFYHVGKHLTGTINISFPKLYDALLYDNNAYSDEEQSEFVTNENGIDFSLPSSETNGKGLYYTADAENYGEDGERIYYFRGDVDNNWVSLGGYLWRIVRTTSEKGMKLVYSGDGNSESSAFITTSMFNQNYNNKYHIGYTYNTELDGYVSEEMSGQTSSTIKSIIDSWYRGSTTSATECNGSPCDFTNLDNVLKNHSSYLSKSAIYCADRSEEQDISGEIWTSGDMYYPAWNRIYNEKRPTYKCPNTNGSRYTADNETGNDYLDYPVGLLNVDEIHYSGIVYNGNTTSSYILDNATSNQWKLNTPFNWNGSSALEWIVNPEDYSINGNTVNEIGGVRPATSLKSCVSVIAGIGTKESPYILSKANCTINNYCSEGACDSILTFEENVQEYFVQYTGIYKVELWGAQGGTGNGYIGGSAAYVSGEMLLDANDTYYLKIGGKGPDNCSNNCGGYNGGGNPGYHADVKNGGGGGATDFSVSNDDENKKTNSRILIAAGGGAGTYYSSSTYSAVGANAGGLFGYTGIGSTQYGGGGSGGSQLLAGLSHYSYCGVAGFGYGASYSQYYCAPGGSGYYGGGGAIHAGGGGGSSFISGHTGCVAIASESDQSTTRLTRIDSNGVLCNSSSSAGYNASGYNTDPLCSEHYSGKVFTETLMIDGAGYKWEIVNGVLVKTLEQMPNPLGGFYDSGAGHTGDGYARITYVEE